MRTEETKIRDFNLGKKNALTQNAQQYFLNRLREEYILLRQQWVVLACSASTCLFGGSMIFRNLAYYRFRVGPRLTQDLGFEYLPEIQSRYTNCPLSILTFLLIFLCARSFFLKEARAIYTVNVVKRLLSVIAIGTILRFFTYISTTLPGSANHCLIGNTNVEYDRPKTIGDIFFMFKGTSMTDGEAGSYNCGDLTFSGHQLTTVTTCLCCLRYAPLSFNMSYVMSMWLMVIVWTIVIIQGCTIIMARQHYTMDVIISCYLTPLIWSWHVNNIDPIDKSIH